LLQFLELIERWNRAYNLTAVREIEQMLPRHVLDSLSVLPYVRGPRVLDIGTGAGLPGIPLALALPAHQFVLIDRNGKKLRFVRQAIHELGLKNVEPVHGVVETYRPAVRFQTLIARALAAIPDMLTGCRHLCAADGAVLAMKGRFPETEIAAVGAGFRVRDVVRLTVPGLDATRHLVILEPVGGSEQRT
ncbi:MAG TPA: 16S rRNA (guanine(527)-N(7))-methyltransferase RsmG, partial [Burkholderiales bacterium]|nr:16S rRNA (guanine(527)-N(7))-methyltransferase RsmG [Burkholderiales bacterium]